MRGGLRQDAGAGRGALARRTGVVAIPKSVKPHRIAENFDVFDLELAADEVAEIDALDTGVRAGPDPEAINMTTYPKRVENEETT
jgi:diketogulonate reductase-like aldo/keto reductase